MAVRIIIDVLMVVGLVFCVAGVKGLIKMPDTFCRMQASTCISTLGAACVLIAALLYAIVIMGSVGTAVKIVVIALMIFITNPIGAHAIAKGAYKAGIRPEKAMEVDDYGRDFNE